MNTYRARKHHTYWYYHQSKYMHRCVHASSISDWQTKFKHRQIYFAMFKPNCICEHLLRLLESGENPRSQPLNVAHS